MNEKIGLQELTRTIAGDCNLDTKVCDTFLRTLFSTIGQALVDGENVKVKGIGTFKSTEVEQRKSVNVNTGQEMIIPGHRKVSFTPDKALAEAVNAPFSMFEPVELADDMTEQMLAAADVDTMPQAEAKDDAAPRPNATEPPAEAVAETAIEPEAEIEIQPEAEIEPGAEHESVNEPELETDLDEPKLQQPSGPENEPESEIVSEQSAENTVNNALATKAETPSPAMKNQGRPFLYPPEEDDYNRNRSHFGKGFLIGVLCTAVAAVCVLVAWRFISPTSLAHVTEGLTGNTNIQAPRTDANATPASIISNVEATRPTDGTAAPAIAPVKSGEAANVPTTPSDQQATASAQSTQEELTKNKDTKAGETTPKAYADKITKKRYLTTMAREYYGNYHLWPFIYDYNKGLGHPDRIRPGTKIKVPTAETLGIDPTDPATISKAKARGIEIYNHYR